MRTVGKYELIEPIGEGGMGMVWKARHVDLHRLVALKQMHADRAGDLMLQRFLREAQSAASVRAPNVVDVLDYGQDASGDPYLVMELLEGESLDVRVRVGNFTAEEALGWIDQALTGLTAIHDAGIVHRDLKPANLFLANTLRDGLPSITVKVVDFGIARPAAPEASALTHTMQTLGTPHFMSPEQVRSAKTVDARADVYAMGVILYQLLTGRLPFEGPSATAIIAAIVTEDPAPVRALRPEIPELIARVVERAMSRRAADRYPDARALREALARARRGIADPTDFGADETVPDPSHASLAPRITPHQSAPTTTASRSRRGFFATFGLLGVVGAVGASGLAWQQRMSTAPAVTATPLTQRAAPAVASVEAAPTTSIIRTRASLADQLVVWRALSAGERERVVVRQLAGSDYTLTTSDEALAGRLATSLFGTVEAVGISTSGASILQPTLLRTNVRANFRQGPSEDDVLLGTAPAHAVIVGLLGEIDGGVSAREAGDPARGGWVRVFASTSVEGWMAQRLLVDETRCVPATDTVRHAVLAREELVEGGRAYPAFITTEPDGWLRIYETDARCMLTERHASRIEGNVADYFVTSPSPHGESILVLGEWTEGHATADGLQRWTARNVALPEAIVWAATLRSGQNLRDREREGVGGPFTRGPDNVEGFFPIRIRGPEGRRFLVWSEEEETFVDVVPSGPEGTEAP
jgi:serine/threonine protein kinase